MPPPADRINAAVLLLARGRPSQPALACEGGEQLDYAGLRERVARAAGAWQDFGVEAGEVVLLRLPAGVERTVALLGAIWAGAVPVPLGDDGSHRGHPWDAHAPTRFILADSRAGYASAWRDSVLTLLEWRRGLSEAGATEPVALPAQAPCCWTEPRRRGGDGARLLRHAFAQLAPREAPGASDEAVDAPTTLALLRALRRGATAVIRVTDDRPDVLQRPGLPQAMALP